MGSKLFAVILLFLLLFPSCIASAWKGEVQEVKNGRALVVQKDSKTLTVYLYGIGVPKSDQPFAQEVKNFVIDSIKNQTVRVQILGSGEKVKAMVYEKGQEKSVNEYILSKGLGWVREAYCEKARLCGRLVQIEGKARRNEKKLWGKVPGNLAAWKWLKEVSD